MHPLLLAAIVASGTALVIYGTYEVSNLYQAYRERQEYESYIHRYQRETRSNEFELPSDDGQDEDDNDDDDNKPLIRHLDNSILRRRRQLQQQQRCESSATRSTSRSSNRPVSDKEWVDHTDYELNELERRITDRKRNLEMEQSLLDQAEMDLARRRRSLEERGNQLFGIMGSSLSEDRQQHATDYELNQGSLLREPSTCSQTLEPGQREENEPKEKQAQAQSQSLSQSSSTYSTPSPAMKVDRPRHKNVTRDSSTSPLNDSQVSSTSFVSVRSTPSRDNNNTGKSDNDTTPPKLTRQQPEDDNAIDLTPTNPWSFEEPDGEEDGDIAITSTFQQSMRLPTSNLRRDGDGNVEVPDDQSSWSALHSDLDADHQHTTSSMVDDDMSSFSSLRSPSFPPSTSTHDDRHSYDVLSHSDIESGH